MHYSLFQKDFFLRIQHRERKTGREWFRDAAIGKLLPEYISLTRSFLNGNCQSVTIMLVFTHPHSATRILVCAIQRRIAPNTAGCIVYFIHCNNCRRFGIKIIHEIFSFRHSPLNLQCSSDLKKKDNILHSFSPADFTFQGSSINITTWLRFFKLKKANDISRNSVLCSFSIRTFVF